MKVLLLLGLVIAADAANRGKSGVAQEGGPGTQTVLLIKGGVGFDVNLLSPSAATTHHLRSGAGNTHALVHKSKSTSSAVAEQAADLKSEQQAAEDLTSQLRTSVSSADKVYGEIKSLREKDQSLERKMAQQQKEVDELKAELKKKELAEQQASALKEKMLLKERRRGDLLEQKVKTLEEDLDVSSKAWREAAVHEKDVAQKDEEVTRDALAKVDRLESQNGPKAPAHRRPVAHVAPRPKAKTVAPRPAVPQRRQLLSHRKKVAAAPRPRQRAARTAKMSNAKAAPRSAVHKVKAMKRKSWPWKANRPADTEPVSPMDVGYTPEDVANDAADAELAPPENEQVVAETPDDGEAPADADVVPADDAPVQEGDSDPNVMEQQPLIQANAEGAADEGMEQEQAGDEEASPPAEEPVPSDSVVEDADQQDAEGDAPVPAAAEDAAEDEGADAQDASPEPTAQDVLTPEAINSSEEPLDTAPEYDTDSQ